MLESLASGLPVVGLRAEGVCDLVKDGQTGRLPLLELAIRILTIAGLLLDLDDLLPVNSIVGSHVPTTSSSGFKPLPENPHTLLETSSATFPIAVSMYRSLLVDLATNHEKRAAFGKAAALDAATKSWHGAMEMLVDGYREIALPSPNPLLALSRTPTLEIDVISHTPNELEESQLSAKSTAASPKVHRQGVGRVLRLGGVLRRSGGRLRDGSMTIPSTFLWRTRASRIAAEQRASNGEEDVLMKHSPHVWTTRTLPPTLRAAQPDERVGWIIKLLLMSYVLYRVLEFLTTSESATQTMALLSVK